ncbi:acyl-CoA N-acyltransferase [Gonapodya prolifera JEL478]|uniref:Acyl-CoA N-acyltransferase n=1 Tax=Gonapodya prolifera (strain JEL478) TaxID=1344416 RepID=A0A139A1M6_GONPJ|nr:acyl-CoA N-acyltransferase [Gonapodya prolifera JEL478]|eukprot:KXS10445.1 acyl-CoA N-acyltransferase [Gonapodya prolifera JEL478]
MPHHIRKVTSAEEVAVAAVLEEKGYPADEAASPETLQFRFKSAPDLFMAAFEGSEMIGFIVATRTPTVELTHSSLTSHDPMGETAAVHSVCVGESWRRRGIALELLAAFAENCRSINQHSASGSKIKRISLIAKQNLVPLYEKAGFILHGKSDVVHGQDPWYELRMEIADSEMAAALQ